MCNYLLIRHQDMRLMTDISLPLEWIQHFWANCQISVIKFVSVFKCNSDFKLKAPAVIISLPCVPWLNTTAWSQISARSNSTRAQMFSVGLSVTITPQGQKFLNNLAGKVLSHLLGLNNFFVRSFLRNAVHHLPLSSMPLFVTAAPRAKCVIGAPAAGVTWKVHQLIITQWQGVGALLRERGAALSFWALCDFDGCPAYFHNPNPTSNL